MLVLSREKHEIIRIGDDIKVMVTELNNNRVHLGIEAPREIPVHREEIYQRIEAQGNKT